MEIAMHCNLSPSNIAPVVLVFNYEAIMLQPTYSKISQHLPTHSARTQQISEQSNNPQLSYCDLAISSEVVLYFSHVAAF